MRVELVRLNARGPTLPLGGLSAWELERFYFFFYFFFNVYHKLLFLHRGPSIAGSSGSCCPVWGLGMLPRRASWLHLKYKATSSRRAPGHSYDQKKLFLNFLELLQDLKILEIALHVLAASAASPL